MKELYNWLDKIGAGKINECTGPNRSKLLFYATGGRTMIVQIFPDADGWEIYTSPTTSLRIDDAFAAAEEMLGITEEQIGAQR